MSKLLLVTVVFLLGIGQALASPYAALSIGRMKLVGYSNNDMPDDIKGGQMTFHGGYKFMSLAAEGFIKASRMKGAYVNGNQENVDVGIKDRIFGLGGRFYFPLPIDIFNMKGGVAFHNKDVDLKVDGVITQSKLDGKEHGLYVGFGGRVPLPVIDIFADLTYYHLDSAGIMDFDLGVRYYF